MYDFRSDVFFSSSSINMYIALNTPYFFIWEFITISVLYKIFEMQYASCMILLYLHQMTVSPFFILGYLVHSV